MSRKSSDQLPIEYEECTCTNPAHGGKLWKCATKECLRWDGKTARDYIKEWLTNIKK